MSGPETDLPDQQFCHLLNVTQCDVTETSETFVVTVYNPLARPIDKFVRLPIIQSGKGTFINDTMGHLLPSYQSYYAQDINVTERSGKMSRTRHVLFLLSVLLHKFLIIQTQFYALGREGIS